MRCKMRDAGEECGNCSEECLCEVADEIKSLKKMIERQRELLRNQTDQTQRSAEYWHEAVLKRIEHLIPECVDKRGHPIDQLVAMVISGLERELKEKKS